MIRTATFKNFRGFEDFQLSDLSPVTLISGKNNVGKSSILEGIFLALDYGAADSFLALSSLRGSSVMPEPDILWTPLFHDPEREIEIEMTLDDTPLRLRYSRDDIFLPLSAGNIPQNLMQFISSAKQTYTLKFDFRYGELSESGHFILNSSGIGKNTTSGGNTASEQLSTRLPVTHYIPAARLNNDSDVTALGKLELEGRKEQVISALRVIDGSISDITTLVIGGQPQLYAKMRGRLLPLKMAGDGVNRLLSILLTIMRNPGPNAVVLIDEIETGFHYSVYGRLWEAVMNTARENRCQVIATTHSYECIQGAVAAGDAARDDFCYFRIDRGEDDDEDDKDIVARRYSGDLLNTAMEMEMEVR
nr:AAA family ATPase [uncultured Fretibacterium sp.]